MNVKMNKKDMYAFPAVLTIDHEDNDAVLVSFPDLDNCFADGNDFADALEEAREALGNVLYWMEKDGQPIPEPSDIRTIEVHNDSIKTLVAVDMIEFRRAWDTRSVNRTVTLPAWLDEMAKKEQVNFSQALQQALKNKLGIDQSHTPQMV